MILIALGVVSILLIGFNKKINRITDLSREERFYYRALTDDTPKDPNTRRFS